MRHLHYAIFLSSGIALSSAMQAQAQECPLPSLTEAYSDYVDYGSNDEQMCSAIISFNQYGIPGIFIADDDDEDECDDSDPTWIPRPPFSSINIIGNGRVSISKLDEHIAQELSETLRESGLMDNYYGDTGDQFISLDGGAYNGGQMDAIRYMMNNYQDYFYGIQEAIQRGDLVYFHVIN